MEGVHWLLLVTLCTQVMCQTTEEPDITTTPEPEFPGLHCYSCYGIGPNNPCENYTSYVRAWKDYDKDLPEQTQTNKVHLKRCAWPYNVTCIVNTFVSNTGEKAHIRDCSDDETFGFPKDKKDRYSVLKNMASNNETKCAWDGGEMICLTKCNSTVFCNGPQLAATSNRVSLVTMVTCLFMCLYVLVK